MQDNNIKTTVIQDSQTGRKVHTSPLKIIREVGYANSK